MYLKQFGDTQASVDVSRCSTVSHFHGGKGPKLLHFMWNLGVGFSRNDMIWIIDGLQMLSKALPFTLMHLKKVVKHLSSNTCVSPCSTESYFPCREGAQKLIFCINLWVIFGRNDTTWTIWEFYILSGALPIVLIYLRKGMRHLSSNECLSL